MKTNPFTQSTDMKQRKTRTKITIAQSGINIENTITSTPRLTFASKAHKIWHINPISTRSNNRTHDRCLAKPKLRAKPNHQRTRIKHSETTIQVNRETNHLELTQGRRSPMNPSAVGRRALRSREVKAFARRCLYIARV